jgi:hypothetical protein
MYIYVKSYCDDTRMPLAPNKIVIEDSFSADKDRCSSLLGSFSAFG